MYKIAVMGDYDSIYGFATLGLSICPVKDRDEAKTKLRQLAEGNYGIIYITAILYIHLPYPFPDCFIRKFILLSGQYNPYCLDLILSG